MGPPLKSAANASGQRKEWPRGYAPIAAASLSIIDPHQVTQGACRTFLNWTWEPAEPPHTVSRSLAKTEPSADALGQTGTWTLTQVLAFHFKSMVRLVTLALASGEPPESLKSVRARTEWCVGSFAAFNFLFTYSVSFAALLAIVATQISFWTNGNETYNDAIIYVLTPVVLVIINSIEIGTFGWIEVVFGTINTYVSILPAMWAYPCNNSPGRVQSAHIQTSMSTSITIYAYVGVEIIAASALEASGTEPGRSVSRRASATVGGRCESQPDAAELVGQRVRFSAIYFPLLAAGAYTISSILASLLIPQSHCSLPHLSWVDPVKCQDGDGVMHTSSMFVIIADEAEIPGLSHIFNGIIVFTALTCANTNLYVASRCLFGLTTRLEGGGRQPPHIRILAVFGKTNKRGVPVNAVIVSALAFCWVPFMQLIRASPIDVVIEILSQMGSVGVIIIWACNCLAYIRFRHGIDEHQKVLEQQQIPRVNRQGDDYPYHSHGQPYLACVAFVGCLFILLISNSSALWNGFEAEAFLSSFLIVSVASFAPTTGLRAGD
ncbi:hypothetical protein S40285_09268 [Stachybotrys chlorohalonatus IBT 40285]|uniref:Amino acid permease/ SLC12A domain-containing protein n=1 Tax=Stachybotrys chlorohalonatus (strain IBT 40285) TaxID=1283841 RepID=A0A084Q7Z6_STAC4|nr:hypothetical protein S40285_09268 [Stachybotrys chlorohalonata IBT 40285]